MIELDGVEYNKYLQVPDWYTSSAVMGGEKMTLYGTLLVRRVPGSSRVLTLTAKLDGSRILGHFTRVQVETLRTLADAGTTVVFNYHGRIANVVVALGGVNLVMVGDRTDPVESHPYVGTVTLLKV